MPTPTTLHTKIIAHFRVTSNALPLCNSRHVRPTALRKYLLWVGFHSVYLCRQRSGETINGLARRSSWWKQLVAVPVTESVILARGRDASRHPNGARLLRGGGSTTGWWARGTSIGTPPGGIDRHTQILGKADVVDGPCDRAARVPANWRINSEMVPQIQCHCQSAGHSICMLRLAPAVQNCAEHRRDSTGAGFGGRRSCEQQRQAPAVHFSSEPTVQTVQKTHRNSTVCTASSCGRPCAHVGTSGRCLRLVHRQAHDGLRSGFLPHVRGLFRTPSGWM